MEKMRDYRPKLMRCYGECYDVSVEEVWYFARKGKDAVAEFMRENREEVERVLNERAYVKYSLRVVERGEVSRDLFRLHHPQLSEEEQDALMGEDRRPWWKRWFGRKNDKVAAFEGMLLGRVMPSEGESECVDFVVMELGEDDVLWNVKMFAHLLFEENGVALLDYGDWEEREMKKYQECREEEVFSSMCCIPPEGDSGNQVRFRISESEGEIGGVPIELSEEKNCKKENPRTIVREEKREDSGIRYSRSLASLEYSIHKEKEMKKKRAAKQQWRLRKLAGLVAEGIRMLQRENGINYLIEMYGEDVTEVLARLPKAVDVSALRLDGECRLLLTDYQNKEVKMSALAKSLYILFLLHPEGVLLKNITDYTEELEKIHSGVSHRDDTEMAVGNLVDLSTGSLNQHISRINKAFREVMSEDFAQHYIVKGKRGELYKVMIDRKMVTIPDYFKM